MASLKVTTLTNCSAQQKITHMYLEPSRTTQVLGEFDQSLLCTPTTPTHTPLFDGSCSNDLYRNKSSACINSCTPYFMSPQPMSPLNHAVFSIETPNQSMLLSPSETIASESTHSFLRRTNSIFSPGRSQSTPQSPSFSPPVSNTGFDKNQQNPLKTLLDQDNSHGKRFSQNRSTELAKFSRIPLRAKSPERLENADTSHKARTTVGDKHQIENKKVKSKSARKGTPASSSFLSLSAISKVAVVSKSEVTNLKFETPVTDPSKKKNAVALANENRLGPSTKPNDEVLLCSSDNTVTIESGKVDQRKMLNGNLIISITNGGRAVLTGDNWYKEKEKNIGENNIVNDELPARPKSAPGVVRSDDAINALKQVIARRASVTSNLNINNKTFKSIRHVKTSEKNTSQPTAKTPNTTDSMKVSAKTPALTSHQILSARLKNGRKVSSSLFPKYHKTVSIKRRNSAHVSKSLVSVKKSPNLKVRSNSMCTLNTSELAKPDEKESESSAAKIQTFGPYLSSSLLQTPFSVINCQTEKPLMPVASGVEIFTLPTTATDQFAHTIYQQHQQHQQHQQQYQHQQPYQQQHQHQQQQLELLQTTLNHDYPLFFSTGNDNNHQQQAVQAISPPEAFVVPFLAQHPGQFIYNTNQVYPTSGSDYYYNPSNYFSTYQMADQQFHLQQQLIHQNYKLQPSNQSQLLDQEHNHVQFTNHNNFYPEITHGDYSPNPSH